MILCLRHKIFVHIGKEGDRYEVIMMIQISIVFIHMQKNWKE